MLYASDNKIKAMEDCIMFSPELFKISKSIIVSEPAIPFTEMIKMKLAIEGRLQDSARSAASSVQSDYIKEKMKEIQAQGTFRSKDSMRGDTMKAMQTRKHTQLNQLKERTMAAI